MNKAYISHIVAAKENFVRGDKELSKELEVAFGNLMLLCDECHNRIDKTEPKRHTVEFLRKMKESHEDRIELLTGIKPKNESSIISFMAKIGTHIPTIEFNEAATAMLPNYFPATHRMIELGVQNYPNEDHQDGYWKVLSSTLDENYRIKVSPTLKTAEINHFSVFGMGPQPLLIKLGTLLSDIRSVKVYTKLREPETWKHPDDDTPIDFEVIKPANTDGEPVLNISITAEIEESRIQKVMEDCSIWKLTVPKPGKDLIRSDRTLENFRMRVREVFEEIKKAHGQESLLHVFPAMPNSTAIEFGRVWQPKAELPMKIYDQNSSRDGFIETITITKRLEASHDY